MMELSERYIAALEKLNNDFEEFGLGVVQIVNKITKNKTISSTISLRFPGSNTDRTFYIEISTLQIHFLAESHICLCETVSNSIHHNLRLNEEERQHYDKAVFSEEEKRRLDALPVGVPVLDNNDGNLGIKNLTLGDLSR